MPRTQHRSPEGPITEPLLIVARHIAAGRKVPEIARLLGRKNTSIHTSLQNLRRLLGCPPGCALAVLTHALLSSQVLTAPTSPPPPPGLTTSAIAIRLLTTLTEHSAPADIANAARLDQSALPTALSDLLTAMRARTNVEAVVLAHAWKLVTPRRDVPCLRPPLDLPTERYAGYTAACTAPPGADDVPAPVVKAGARLSGERGRQFDDFVVRLYTRPANPLGVRAIAGLTGRSYGDIHRRVSKSGVRMNPQGAQPPRSPSPVCKHSPTCPAPTKPVGTAARPIRSCPEQGWSLLCNGVLLFEDTGAILPNGKVVGPFRPGQGPRTATPPSAPRNGRRSSAAPPPARLVTAAYLRCLRRARGISVRSTAEAVDTPAASIYRWESAKIAPPPDVLARLLLHYGAGEHVGYLTRGAASDRAEMVRRPADGMWTDAGAEAALRYLAVTRIASKITEICVRVPVGLRTPAYEAAVLKSAAGTGPGERDLEWVRRVRTAADQQRTVLLDETVLTRQTGEPEVRADQLRHLASLANSESPGGQGLVIRILPKDQAERLRSTVSSPDIADAMVYGHRLVTTLGPSPSYGTGSDAVRTVGEAVREAMSCAWSREETCELLLSAARGAAS